MFDRLGGGGGGRSDGVQNPHESIEAQVPRCFLSATHALKGLFTKRADAACSSVAEASFTSWFLALATLS